MVLAAKDRIEQTWEDVRTCVKEGHQCTRKIVSFCKMASKSTFRQAHKCCQIILSALPTWEIWSLSASAPAIRKEVAQLKSLEEHKYVCYRCGREKDPVELLVSDCAQF